MKIRRLKLEDAPFMLEWMHDDNVVKDLQTDFRSKTIEDCIQFISDSLTDKNNLHWAITDEKDNYMGTVSLKNIFNNTAEFAITVRQAAMGAGYAKWAMEEILKKGFEEIKLKKIYWYVSPKNVRAIRFYDKNGYVKCDMPLEARCYSAEQKDYYVWYEVLI